MFTAVTLWSTCFISSFCYDTIVTSYCFVHSFLKYCTPKLLLSSINAFFLIFSVTDGNKLVTFTCIITQCILWRYTFSLLSSIVEKGGIFYLVRSSNFAYYLILLLLSSCLQKSSAFGFYLYCEYCSTVNILKDFITETLNFNTAKKTEAFYCFYMCTLVQ